MTTRISLLQLTRLVPVLMLLLIPFETSFAAKSENAVVTFEAHDYGFKGPDQIAAGLVTIQIVNAGSQLHHIQLIRLNGNKTLADFDTALRNNPSALPPWINFTGGPNAVIPGENAVATGNLPTGDYVLLCLIPNDKGVPHFALGMQKALRVASSPVISEGKRVRPQIRITQVDFAFGMSREITSGVHTIEVINTGLMPHEVVVVKLAPGASIQDFAKFGEHPAGPPPGQPVGGVGGLDNGSSASFTAKFEAGTYGLICFFPDPQTGAPHFTKGMMTEFTVKK